MNKGVAVTGIGVISAIGNNAEENYQSLIRNNHGISFPEILKTSHSHLPVGEIKITDRNLALQLGLPENHSFTRAALLGAIALKEAISQAGLSKNDLLTTGLISASSVGGMDKTEEFYREFNRNEEVKRFIRAQHPGYTTDQIRKYAEIGGYTTTISTACSSSANAIMLGARLIKAGKLTRVIVGGTDCLTKFTLNGFNSLKILSSQHCKPFDQNRNGLNLGEGAGCIVLEADDVLKYKPVLGRIAGYGNANDAFHQTASSATGEGAFLAMSDALRIAEIDPAAIDYVNAHGTATGNNDLSESVALKRIFEDNVPMFSSTKGFTGHTLAAAGIIEAVYSLLSLQKAQVFANLNFEQEMEETGLTPITSLHSKQLKYILSNSFGFGGNCTSIILSNHGE